MSLVPYHPREGREVVLRHHNAIVVRDPSSQRLELRGLELHECPTCHQPLRRSSSPNRHHFDTPGHGDTYVDPNYFRMLRAGYLAQEPNRSTPSSPIRRLVEPLPGVEHDEGETEAEIPPSAPSSAGIPHPQRGRIRREAFTPGYFNTFFIEEKELGRGGKGVVLLVRHEIDGCNLGHFACKRVPVGDDHAWLEKVLVEVELLAKLSHPNLVSYRHVWLEDVQLNRFGPSVACAFILQQYCNGGDLLRYIVGDKPKEATKEELKEQMRRRSRGQLDQPRTQKRLSPAEIYSLFKDITSGLAYLHGANYIHRDLKPSNCLLHKDGSHLKCLISDFGEVQAENVMRKSTGSTGTISFCAPEVLKKDATGRYGNFTTKSDIFSLGLILYFMCFGRLPYDNANVVNEELEDIDQLRDEITRWKGFREERRERPDLPSSLYQLLKRLLALNPAERPTAQEVLESLDNVVRPKNVGPPIGLGLSSGRVQNLDSPVRPVAPVPEPSKRPRSSSSFPSDDDDPDVTSPTAPHPNHSGHSNSLTLARAPLLNPPPSNRPGHLSPSSNLAHLPVPSTPPSPSPSHRSRPISRQGSRTPSPTTQATLTTPLLMPPPATGFARVRERASEWVEQPGLGSVLRFGLFVGKMVSLWGACWPYSVEGRVFVVGVLLAGWDVVDFANPVPGPERSRVNRQRGVNGTEGRGRRDGVDIAEWLLKASWRRSLVLLIVHCAVLGWVWVGNEEVCAAQVRA